MKSWFFFNKANAILNIDTKLKFKLNEYKKLFVNI